MRYSILGFSQKMVCSLTKTIKRDGKADLVLKLDMTDLLILRQLADFPNRKKTKKQIVDDKLFFWVDYKGLLEELPILDIKKQALRDRLDKMVELNLLEKAVVNFDRLGSATCFRMGDNYETLLYSDENKQSTTQGCVVDYTGDGSELHDININEENKGIKEKENILKESEIVKFWNEKTTDYPKVKIVSAKIKRAINARIKDGYSVDDIKKAILLMNGLGDFYKGRGDSSWRADFLWLMQNTKGNFDKILSGGLHVTPIQQQYYKTITNTDTLDFEPTESKPQPVLGIGEFLRPDGTRTYGSGIITIPNDAPPRRYSNEAWVNGKWTVI
jgi:hypothetical protein